MFGPKCTGFIIFMSIWGAIFLAILGALYRNHSVGLLDNLPDEPSGAEQKAWSERKADIITLFNQNAINCWVAAAIYAGLAALGVLRAICLRNR